MHGRVRRVRALFVATSLLLAATFAPARVARADADVVPVPDVVGKTLEEAKAALGASGLLVATVEVAGAPEGTVAGQKPSDGASLPVGGAVVLEVRRAATPTKAPNAVGLTTAEASNAFGSLYVLEFVPRAGAVGDRGKVVAQEPAAGASIDLRGRLRLAFRPDDTLPPRVAVPDATGLSAAEALQAMAAAGLHARIASVVVPGAPADLAVGQSPLPGTEADRYETVDVIVTTEAPAPATPEARPTVVVPDVLGMTESSARATLTDAGLGATLEWVDGDPASAFLVRSQEPLAGTSVDPGVAVTFRVVRWSPPASPPGTTKVAVPGPRRHDGVAGRGPPHLARPAREPAPRREPRRPPAARLRAADRRGHVGRPGHVDHLPRRRPAPPSHPVPVPDFYGRTKSASLLLAASWASSSTRCTSPAPTKPAHRVFSQSVAAWSVVPVGTHVTVWIATHPGGPATVAVPNLVGKTAGQAVALLAAAGLAGAPQSVWALGKPPLKVFDQDPNAGTPVVAGSTVSFHVAKLGPLLSIVPDVFGKTAAAPRDALGVGLLHDRRRAGRARQAVREGVRPAPERGRLPPARHRDRDPDLEGPRRDEGRAAPDRQDEGGGARRARLPRPRRRPHRRLGAGEAARQGLRAGAARRRDGARREPGRLQGRDGSLPAEDRAGPLRQDGRAGRGRARRGGARLRPRRRLRAGEALGLVYTQDPPPSAHVVAGTVVKHYIAGPPGALRIVPELLGKTKMQANAALAAVGLAGNATEEICLTCPVGRVNGESRGGLERPVGSVVAFAIAKGLVVTMFTTVPHLDGLTGAQADAALAAKGLASDGSVQWKCGEPLTASGGRATPRGRSCRRARGQVEAQPVAPHRRSVPAGRRSRARRAPTHAW